MPLPGPKKPYRSWLNRTVNPKTAYLLLALILVLAATGRFIFAAPGSFVYDMNAFRKGIWVLLTRPYDQFYQYVATLEVGYLSFPLYLFAVLGQILVWQGKVNLIISNPMYVNLLYYLKSPAIVFDLLLGVAIFWARKKDTFRALLTVILLLFNPAVFYLSAVWGQYESIYLFWLFLAMVFVTRKPILSAVMLCLAFLTKPQTVILMPLFGLYYASYHRKKCMTMLLLFIGITMTAIIPFIDSNPFGWLYAYFQRLGSETISPYINISAYNFWNVVFPPQTSVSYLYRGYYEVKMLAVFLFGLIFLTLHGLIFRQIVRRKPVNRFFAAAMCFFAFYLFGPQMRERYLFPVVGFLAVVALERWQYFVGYIMVSILMLVNLSTHLEKFLPEYLVFSDRNWIGQAVLFLRQDSGRPASYILLAIFVFYVIDFIFHALRAGKREISPI